MNHLRLEYIFIIVLQVIFAGIIIDNEYEIFFNFFIIYNFYKNKFFLIFLISEKEYNKNLLLVLI